MFNVRASVLAAVRNCVDAFSRASTTKKVLIVSGVTIILLLLRLSAHHRDHNLHGESASLSHDDTCLLSHISSLESHMFQKLIPLGHHTETGKDWLPSWAGTGNDELFIDVTSGELSIQTGKGLSRLPWSRLQPFRIDQDGHSESLVDLPIVTLVDVVSVAVRQFSRLPGPSCAILEQTWYAHKAHHGLVVQHISLFNEGKPLTVHLRPIVDGSIQAPGPSTTVTQMKLGDNSEAVVVSRTESLNVSARAGSVGETRHLTYLTVRERTTAAPTPTADKVTATLPVAPTTERVSGDRATMAITELDAISTMAEPLFHLHEAFWAKAREDTHVVLRGLGALDQLVPLSHHYFISALGLLPQLTSEPSPCGCYSAAPQRQLSDWRLPKHAASVPVFMQHVQTLLANGCCQVHPEREMQANIQSLAQAVAGIELTADMVRIAPSYDIPPGGHVELAGIKFGRYSFAIDLHNDGIALIREDRLSSPLLVVSAEGAVSQLGQRRIEFSADTVYIGTDRARLEQAYRMDHVKPRLQEHPRSRAPRWITSFLIIAVILFHVALVRLVYRELSR
eukprot:m.245309 g.245309  ORF g.245309 m.245309 type:complete len:565 (-) comp14674_c0_seq1:135-1829(-)